MDELNQFLNSVEASARKILKQQNKKQQELLARDRVALARGGKKTNSDSANINNNSSSIADNGVSRDELRATYGGGSLIIQAPSPRSHPVSANGRRSEHASESEDTKHLPRISGQGSGNESLRGSVSSGPFLPVIDKRLQQQKDRSAAALEAAKRANRESRRASSSLKVLDSPLYKSLSKVKSDQGFGSSSPTSSSSSSPQAIKKAIHDVDNVSILLKKMGLRESSSSPSPSRRLNHAVERRMCNACWVNNVALSDDRTLSLDDPYGDRRHWDMMNKDSFRQWWLVENSLPLDLDVAPQECNVQIAQPNATGVCGRFCWHSTDSVNQLLCRRRLEKDFVDIVHNDIPSGSHDPMYFVVSMVHEVMLHVLAAYLAMLAERQRKREYETKLLEIEQRLEVGRLMLEAKCQEQKRIEQELQASAVLKRDKSAGMLRGKMAKPDTLSDTSVDTKVLLQEWELRMAQSVVKDEQGDWQRREITADDALVVFYHSLNQHLPPIRRYSWNRPDGWQEQSTSSDTLESGDGSGDSNLLTSRSDSSSVSSSNSESSEGDPLDAKQRENDESMAQITHALLEDEQFLQILKDKLELSALEATMKDQALNNSIHSKKKRKSTSHAGDDDDEEGMDDEALQMDWDDQMASLTEESDVDNATLMLENDPAEAQLSMDDRVNKAILCARNMNGNTGLHYLHEYKHTELAEYLKAKGAVNTIQNASGLTCYEELSADQLEQINDANNVDKCVCAFFI